MIVLVETLNKFNEVYESYRVDHSKTDTFSKGTNASKRSKGRADFIVRVAGKTQDQIIRVHEHNMNKPCIITERS